MRRDSFDTTTLTKIFNTPALKKAGYTVAVHDKSNAQSTLDISGSFSNEEQLRAALSVIAPPSVLNATFSKSTSLLKEKQNVSLTVDVPKLRKLYLQNDDVKKSVEAAGIDFNEFEAIINDAMKSTTFTVKISTGKSADSQTFTGSSKHAQTMGADTSFFRTRFFLNVMGALVAGILAIVLLWRTCRTPRLLSETPPSEQAPDIDADHE